VLIYGLKSFKLFKCASNIWSKNIDFHYFYDLKLKIPSIRGILIKKCFTHLIIIEPIYLCFPKIK